MVVGAGPAGAVTALNLARFFRVLLVDKAPEPTQRIGESLPAAANRLLRDMGLLDSFLAQGHLPSRVIHSTWGDDRETAQDEMRNLDGHGWYLDRPRFDVWLRQEARRRGAALWLGARLTEARRAGPALPWQVKLESPQRNLTVEARFVVDATGRTARLSRLLGVERIVQDKLVCGWVSGADQAASGEAGGGGELHAEPGGWWYSSALPGRRRILAFFTDSDLPAATDARDSRKLLHRLADVPRLPEALAQAGFTPDGGSGFCAAFGVTHSAATGDSWLAVGDAAVTFDPLSSQGIFNALYTGLAGATAIHAHLEGGDSSALSEYQAEIDRIAAAYQTHRRAWYAGETRWPAAPFWRRRAGAEAIKQGHEDRARAPIVQGVGP